MEGTEFKAGNYYFIYNTEEHNPYCMICKATSDGKLRECGIQWEADGSLIHESRLCAFSRDYKGFCFKDRNRDFRLANSDEIAWIEACIRERKWVPKPEEPVVNNTYSIF